MSKKFKVIDKRGKDTASKQKARFKERTEEDLHKLAEDINKGLVFTDRHIPKETRVESLGLVFMPIALGGFKDWSKTEVGNIGMLFEYIEKSSPVGESGLPVFGSVQYLTADQAETVVTKIQEIRKSEDENKNEE